MSFFHVGWLVGWLVGTGIDSGRIDRRKGSETQVPGIAAELGGRTRQEKKESFVALPKNQAKHPIRWSLTSSH